MALLFLPAVQSASGPFFTARERRAAVQNLKQIGLASDQFIRVRWAPCR